LPITARAAVIQTTMSLALAGGTQET